MGFPISDLVMLSVFAASIFAGFAMWWWLSLRTREMQFELRPMTALMKFAPQPANEVIEEVAPDSSVRIRVGVYQPARNQVR